MNTKIIKTSLILLLLLAASVSFGARSVPFHHEQLIIGRDGNVYLASVAFNINGGAIAERVQYVQFNGSIFPALTKSVAYTFIQQSWDTYMVRGVSMNIIDDKNTTACFNKEEGVYCSHYANGGIRTYPTQTSPSSLVSYISKFGFTGTAGTNYFYVKDGNLYECSLTFNDTGKLTDYNNTQVTTNEDITEFGTIITPGGYSAVAYSDAQYIYLDFYDIGGNLCNNQKIRLKIPIDPNSLKLSYGMDTLDPANKFEVITVAWTDNTQVTVYHFPVSPTLGKTMALSFYNKPDAAAYPNAAFVGSMIYKTEDGRIPAVHQYVDVNVFYDQDPSAPELISNPKTIIYSDTSGSGYKTIVLPDTLGKRDPSWKKYYLTYYLPADSLCCKKYTNPTSGKDYCVFSAPILYKDSSHTFADNFCDFLTQVIDINNSDANAFGKIIIYTPPIPKALSSGKAI